MNALPARTPTAPPAVGRREEMMALVESEVRSAIRMAYSRGLADGSRVFGTRSDLVDHAAKIETEIADALYRAVEEAASPRALENGRVDCTTFDDITSALDQADVPRSKFGCELTVFGRIDALIHERDLARAFSAESTDTVTPEQFDAFIKDASSELPLLESEVLA